MKLQVLVFLVCFVVSNGFGAARIECVQKAFDFGEMHDGQTAEHTFVIKNTGGDILTIGKVRACCGSTAVISSSSIEPGQSAELKVVLPLKNRSGAQDKNVFIASNDPINPYLQLKIIGEVTKRVSIEPRSVLFKDLKLGESKEQVVTITSSIPMNIIKIESSSKAFIATESTKDHIGKAKSSKAFLTTKITRLCLEMPFTRPTETYYLSYTKGFLEKDNKDNPSENYVPFVAEITISTVSDMLVKGLNRGTVTLHTDNKDYPKIRVYCRAYVEDSIKITPSEIVIKKSDKLLTRYIAIRSKDTVFKVLGVTSPINDIKITHKKQVTNGYLFVVSNIPSDEVLNGTNIVISTDIDGGREIEIPIIVKGE